MPTVEQMKLRREKILYYVEALADGSVEIADLPKNLRVAVLAHSLELGIISAYDVPPACAQDVALSFLKDAANRERDRAADRGTDVHSVIERLSLGEIFEVPSEYADHIESWRQFCSDYKMRFIETEFSVFSPTYYYAGTGDFLGYSDLHPEWGLIAGDYKTSESGIWPDVALQLAAIRYADFIGREDLSEDRDVLPEIKTFVGVQITAEGYRVVRTRVTANTFRVFLAAAHVARWKRDFEKFALDPNAEFIPRKVPSV